MKTSTAKVAMKNGIDRFEKVEGASAPQRMLRYNSGAVRYELECAFRVLRRCLKTLPSANNEELRELVIANTAANAVLVADIALGDAISAWLPTCVNEGINVPIEEKLLQAMNEFDNVVAELKPYL